METKLKEVTNEYAQAQNKQYHFNNIFNCILALFLLICCFLPVAKIGEYSIGNTFEIVINFFKNINTESSSKYILYFAIFSLVAILCAVLLLNSGVQGLIAFKKYQNLEGSKVFISENNKATVVTFKYIIKKVICLLVYSFIAYSFIKINEFMVDKYAFTSNWNIFIAVFFIIAYIKNVTCSFFTSIYDEKGVFGYDDINNIKIDKPNKRKAYKKNKTIKDLTSWGAIYNHHPILSQIIIIVFVICLGGGVYHNAMYAGYDMVPLPSRLFGAVTPIPSMFENLMSESIKEKNLYFDDKELNKNTYLVVKESGSGNLNIKLEYENNGNYESNTKAFYFYGDSYDYSMAKIEELEKEILSLWPEDNTKEAMEQYSKKIEHMANAIKVLKSNIHSYEYISFIEGYIVDIQYNATGKSGVKWGVEEEGLKGLMFNEKITLTDKYCKKEKDMDRFAVGTDFNKELIVAEVKYTDGSTRISRVKPTNIEELNNAKAGEHLLKWSDSWGKYETTITLYNE